MKSKIFLISFIILIISCKSAKEKRSCFENIKDKTILNINTFNNLKTYLRIEENEFEDVLYIIDGIPIEDSLIKHLINKKDFDLLDAKYLNIETTTFCKPSAKIILISTNKCLNKYKWN